MFELLFEKVGRGGVNYKRKSDITLSLILLVSNH
jgi:hypothetical protein